MGLLNHEEDGRRGETPPIPTIETDDKTKAPKLKAGEARQAQIKGVQKQHAAKVSELKSTRASGPTRDENVRVITAQLGGLKAEGDGQPNVAGLGRGAPRVTWSVMQVAAEASGSSVPNAPNPWPLLVSLHHDTLLERAIAQIDAYHAEHGEGMTEEDRKAKVKALNREVLELERLECAIVWAARDEGLDLPFRGDLDPRAVLGVVGPVPESKRLRR